jgi:signal transduction histidine kinase
VGPPTATRWQTLYRRFLALVVRPTAPPLWLGVLVAAGFIAVEWLLVVQLKRVAPENAFGAVFLLGVLVVSAGWGFGLAVATSLASAGVYVYIHSEGADSFVPAVLVFLSLALLANVLVGQARLRALEAEQHRREADLRATQQAALRAVATLVARGAEPSEVYRVAVTELARGLGVEHATLVGYREQRAGVVLATTDSPGRATMVVGEEFPLAGDNLSAQIVRTGEPARIDDYSDANGAIADRMRGLGVCSGVGAPVVVDGEVRAALMVGSIVAQPLPARTEDQVSDFADLIATSIANAENRAELTASRARIVAAADAARRGFERDLHDGAQQRIVSLGLQLRALQAAAQGTTRQGIDRAVDDLMEVHEHLQEISRGIHPAILSRGGLGPAIKTLARRSAVPVTLDSEVDRRLPESVEVAAYYVVAEALTNTAKHAQASEIRLHASGADGELRITISDDGVGGATTGGGSGLIGLKDRIEAVDGRLDIASPAGGGTTLRVTIPLDG